jgi:hypothetical protein
VLQTIIDFVVRLWSRGHVSDSEKLKQAEAIVEMSLKLSQTLEARLQLIESRLDERDRELDDLKLERKKDHEKIGEMQTRLNTYEVEVQQYKRTISEMTLHYEKTISELQQRIVELEAKSDA